MVEASNKGASRLKTQKSAKANVIDSRSKLSGQTQVVGSGNDPSIAGKVTAAPKFLMGVKPDVRPGIIMYDDFTLIFVCGNNVVIQKMELNKEQEVAPVSQNYIPGIEGSEGITTLALSPCKQWLAVCERASQAICSIYSMQTFKRKKILTSSEYKANEFVAAAFSNTKAMDYTTHYLITVTGEPDFSVKLWLFDKQRFIAQYDIQAPNCSPTQISFHPEDNTKFLVTGHDVYNYLKVMEQSSIKGEHVSFLKNAETQSVNYTGHLWLAQKLIVTTADGQILIGEQTGEFKIVLPESPGEKFPIRRIVPAKDKNFIITDDSGRFKYYQYTGEPKSPWVLKKDLPLGIDTDDSERWSAHLKTLRNAPHFPVTGLGLFMNDYLVYTTENRQIMKLKFNEETKPKEFGKVSFLSVPFHSGPITAITTCLKRPFVVTSSTDKTIRVWSYASGQSSGQGANSTQVKLDICETMFDEVRTMAIHPSGNYLIASFASCVQFLNIYPTKLEKYHELNIHACVEIKFTTHGNLVAIQNQGTVEVYKFFTVQLPNNYRFSKHAGSLKTITWNEDDSGFVTTARDGMFSVWELPKLKPANEDIKNEPKWTYQKKLTHIQSTAIIKQETEFKSKDQKPIMCQVVFAAVSSNNRYCIYEVHQDIGTADQGFNNANDVGILKRTFDIGVNLQQILLYTGKKCLLGAVNSENRLGSLVSVQHPFSDEKPFELQLHQQGISKMCLNFDHTQLFTASEEGSFSFLQMYDKDFSRKRDPVPAPAGVLHYCEVVIPKAQLDTLQEEIRTLKTDIQMGKETNQRVIELNIKKKNEEIERLTETLHRVEQVAAQKKRELEAERDAVLAKHKEKKDLMEHSHQRILDQMSKNHAQKASMDAKKLQDLGQQSMKQMEANNKAIAALKAKFEQEKQERMAHEIEEKDQLTQQEEKMKQNLEEIDIVNKELHQKMWDDSWKEIGDRTERNKSELAIRIEEGLKDKGELTQKQKEMRDFKARKEQLVREQNDQNGEFKEKLIQTRTLQQENERNLVEIHDRNVTLEDKKKRILELRKKIQELEKFKFVLNYKIKELKLAIGPSSVKIIGLNEQYDKMKGEMSHFNRVNANLALIVEDMRMRQEGLKKELTKMTQTLAAQEKKKLLLEDNVVDLFTHSMQDFKKLKRAVVRLYRGWVQDDKAMNSAKGGGGGSEVDSKVAEQNNRRYLESSVTSLRDRLRTMATNHQEQSKRIQRENVALITDINFLKQQQYKLTMRIFKQKKMMEGQNNSMVPYTDESVDENFGNGNSASYPKSRSFSAKPGGRPPPGKGGSRTRAKSARQMHGSLIKKLEIDYDTCNQEWEAVNLQMKEMDQELEMLQDKLEQARLISQHHHIGAPGNQVHEGEEGGVATGDEGSPGEDESPEPRQNAASADDIEGGDNDAQAQAVNKRDADQDSAVFNQRDEEGFGDDRMQAAAPGMDEDAEQHQ